MREQSGARPNLTRPCKRQTRSLYRPVPPQLKDKIIAILHLRLLQRTEKKRLHEPKKTFISEPEKGRVRKRAGAGVGAPTWRARGFDLSQHHCSCPWDRPVLSGPKQQLPPLGSFHSDVGRTVSFSTFMPHTANVRCFQWECCPCPKSADWS